jgi:hypothetical protein
MQVLATLFFTNIACTGNTTSYSGHGTYDYMAFDGDRLWRYQNESEAIDYTLVVEKADAIYDSNTGTETATFVYSKEEPVEALGSVTWISGLLDGIGITSYTTADDQETIFETPIIFTKNRMTPGATVTTETDGVVFTGTMHGIEECPNQWNTTEVWECLHFSLSVDLDDHPYPFVGDYWKANGWGVSRLLVGTGNWSAESDWVLTYANCKYDGVDC